MTESERERYEQRALIWGEEAKRIRALAEACGDPGGKASYERQAAHAEEQLARFEGLLAGDRERAAEGAGDLPTFERDRDTAEDSEP